jgi:hypothetical protein
MARLSMCVVLGIVAVGGLPLGSSEKDSYFPAADKDGGWRVLADAQKIRTAAGMDLRRLDQAFEFEKETSQHGGLLVVRHGYLVYEKYFGQGNREAHPDMASIGKAFTSVSCGIMLKEKRDLFREHGCVPGPVTAMEVEARSPAVMHTVTMAKVAGLVDCSPCGRGEGAVLGDRAGRDGEGGRTHRAASDQEPAVQERGCGNAPQDARLLRVNPISGLEPPPAPCALLPIRRPIQ